MIIKVLSSQISFDKCSYLLNLSIFSIILKIIFYNKELSLYHSFHQNIFLVLWKRDLFFFDWINKRIDDIGKKINHLLFIIVHSTNKIRFVSKLLFSPSFYAFYYCHRSFERYFHFLYLTGDNQWTREFISKSN